MVTKSNNQNEHVDGIALQFILELLLISVTRVFAKKPPKETNVKGKKVLNQGFRKKNIFILQISLKN